MSDHDNTPELEQETPEENTMEELSDDELENVAGGWTEGGGG